VSPKRPSRLASVARWLGAPGSERLSGAVAVLSPHLDDGVFSLGASIAAASDASVVMLTVLAGDPESELPAGEWDSRAGFRRAGQATRARRQEDARACEEVGARPEWLPYPDHQYPRPDDDGIWEDIERALGQAETVLVPAFPLMHEDHRWLLGLVEGHGLPGRRVGHYVEQPYAAAWESRRPGEEWAPLAAALPHRMRKLRACRRYVTQLPLLERQSSPVLLRMLRYEAARGGELVRWP